MAGSDIFGVICVVILVIAAVIILYAIIGATIAGFK